MIRLIVIAALAGCASTADTVKARAPVSRDDGIALPLAAGVGVGVLGGCTLACDGAAALVSGGILVVTGYLLVLASDAR